MPCTTILVGKKASNDGSTMIARNDDGAFRSKRLIVVNPKDQPRKYKTKISHLTVNLPDNPCRYTSTPSVNVNEGGIWPANGINEYNVGMTATETITSNPRVLAADPLVKYQPKEKGKKEVPGGIGEEDLVLIVLPYIKTAREGVLRLGSLLEQYGTYEMNGIAFNDKDECWWLESIGGHHWIAKRVPDDRVVIMPNQFGLDNFDFKDAMGEGKENLCSKDLEEFISKNSLLLKKTDVFNPRFAFGSAGDSDHIYNNPRAWFIGRYFCPTTHRWDGPGAEFTPESDYLPWSLVPEKKVTVEDIKYILSSHYQGTPFDPYVKADNPFKGKYRPIAVANTEVMAVLQIRNNVPKEIAAVEWICYGCNVFNTITPLYTNVSVLPKYFDTTNDIDTKGSFSWASRILGALADHSFAKTILFVERYQAIVMVEGRRIINECDSKYLETKDIKALEKANDEIAKMTQKETNKVLDNVLSASMNDMKVRYFRGDN